MDPGLVFIARGYLELRTERNTMVFVRSGKDGGIGSVSAPGPIPWSAMLRWCRWHELSREVTEHVIAVIGMVDQRMRKVAFDKLKQAR